MAAGGLERTELSAATVNEPQVVNEDLAPACADPVSHVNKNHLAGVTIKAVACVGEEHVGVGAILRPAEYGVVDLPVHVEARTLEGAAGAAAAPEVQLAHARGQHEGGRGRRADGSVVRQHQVAIALSAREANVATQRVGPGVAVAHGADLRVAGASPARGAVSRRAVLEAEIQGHAHVGDGRGRDLGLRAIPRPRRPAARLELVDVFSKGPHAL
mmetsp:Transcript_54236/g.154492  ORF Transcript_54236/g.154492 Transcript_54236/m.154492 type:complete len:215 (+) Transcript_54236:215-859(+)